MHIAEVINKLIREYQSGNAPVDSHIDAVIVREHVLPGWRDMGGCYALRPNGEVIFFGWDDMAITIGTDPRIRNFAFAQAARTYAQLSEFVPQRPTSARSCDVCNGTGMPASLPAHLADSIVCQCGGLGWLSRAKTPN
jgi:hypothetical protein